MPKNDQIWPKIGIFGQFGPGYAGLFSALLVGRLVVVARGLHLARHLLTLLYHKKYSVSGKYKDTSQGNLLTYICARVSLDFDLAVIMNDAQCGGTSNQFKVVFIFIFLLLFAFVGVVAFVFCLNLDLRQWGSSQRFCGVTSNQSAISG